MSIDRLTLGGNSSRFFNRAPKWRVGDVLVLIIALVLSYPVYYQKPFERQFTINDLTLSHPYAVHQRVSDAMLFVYSFIVPLVVILVVVAMFADPKHRWYLLYISILGLCISTSLTTLFTDFIKNWIGRLRPDFLDRCKPKHGLPINTLFYASEVCTTDHHEILLDGFRTTPSGHSSESFAGMGYLYFWLCGQLLTEVAQIGIWRKLIALIPILLASLIALSRTQDYRHHFVDVLLGSALGFIIAHFTYRRYFPATDSAVPFKPLFDDSDVTIEIVTHPSTGAELEPLSV